MRSDVVGKGVPRPVIWALVASIFACLLNFEVVREVGIHSDRTLPQAPDMPQREENSRTVVIHSGTSPGKHPQSPDIAYQEESSHHVQKHTTTSHNTPSLNPEATSCGKNRTIAYAITVTHCPLEKLYVVVDGAAVLGQSIHRHSIRSNSTSRYDYALFAFVHSDAMDCVNPLRQLGYAVQVKDDYPFDLSKMSPEQRNNLEPKGCCGAKEYLKLYAYSLTDYPLAMHLDTDTLILQPMDRVWDSLLGCSELQAEDMASIQHHRVPNKTQSIEWSQIDFLFTRDYEQQSTYSKNPKHYGVQGGFFVVRPNQTTLNEIASRIEVAIYRKLQGWDSRGYGGYWGERQIQGFLSYVYGEYYSNRALELNRCRYNSMIEDNPYDDNGKCRTLEDSCEDCYDANWQEVVLVHLTTCRKPWDCPRLHKRPTPCRDAHRAWFETRRELELSWNQTPPRDGYNPEWTLSYCTKEVNSSKREYQAMKLPHVA